MNMNKYIFIFGLILIPNLAFARTGETLASLVEVVVRYLNLALVLLMALATFFFIFYVIKYFIIDADSDKNEAKTYVIYSIIGFFLIFSFWGLVNILQNTFNLDNGSNTPGSWNEITNIFPQGSGSGGRRVRTLVPVEESD